MAPGHRGAGRGGGRHGGGPHPVHSGLPIEDGTGWSFQYRYNSATELSIFGTVPGVLVSIAGTDFGGDRTLSVLLKDTAAGDGLCAALALFTDDGVPIGNRISTCDGSVTVPMPTVSGDVTVVPYQAFPGAHVTGNGWREGPDTRGARFTIFWTGGSDCVQRDIQGEGDVTIPGGNIGVACPFGSGGSGVMRGMHNYIQLRAFAGLHSLRGAVAAPFRLDH